ncbi:MAG: hypothetical protein KDD40_02675, partial [Bdellovibrionales bacterium]|nr:hypothetical protein [Bdellovibrionales bacterium]
MKVTLSENKILKSNLKQGSFFSNDNENVATNKVIPLLLTPLVDAFAILVIYLLVNTTAAQHHIQVDESLKLPMAKATSELKQG